VTVRRINDDHVNTGFSQQFDALFGTGTGANGSTGAQMTGTVLVGQRMFGGLENILDRNQAAQMILSIDDQHALEAVLADQFLGIFDAGFFIHRHQTLARRHDQFDRLVEIGFKAQIAVGNNTDDLARLVDHRQAGNTVLAGNLDDITHCHHRRNGDRVTKNAGFKALDLGDFSRLGLRRKVLVNDADATFLSQRDGETAFRHGIHGGGKQRHVQGNVASQSGRQAGVARKNLGVGGDK
jgi:hypothetical protein